VSDCRNILDKELFSARKLWKKEFNETLSPDKAHHHASLLLELYGLLARPLPEERSAPPDPDPTKNLS